jgi:hypothetical protein
MIRRIINAQSVNTKTQECYSMQLVNCVQIHDKTNYKRAICEHKDTGMLFHGGS